MDPVISKKGGYLFERSVVEKLILETGTCPVSGDPLSVDDLLAVQSNKAVRPRNMASASIPGMLATFQNEWDEVMLEVFSLKQHLDSTRQELSQALYQHDAACRVIARLMRERDEARAMLTGAGVAPPAPSSSGSSNSSSMDVDENNTNGKNTIANAAEQGETWPSMSQAISTVALSLSDARKQRPKKIPPTTRDAATFAEMSAQVSNKPHKASGAVTCIAVGSDDLVVTGGADKDLHVLSASTGKSVVKVPTGHKKEVTAIALQKGTARGMLLSGSADHTVKLWSLGENAKKAQEMAKFSCHEGAISALCAHPVDNLACSFSADGTVAMMDLEQQQLALRLGAMREFSYLSGAVHPDAVMLGGGTDNGALKVWDVRQMSVAVNLTDHSPKGVTAVDFSNNGYYVCTGDAVGDFRCWDLRKLKCLHTESLASSAITSVSFDNYGLYAAVGAGSEVQTWQVKEWKKMSSFSAHSKEVTGVSWGNHAQYLASCGLDGVVNLFK